MSASTSVLLLNGFAYTIFDTLFHPIWVCNPLKLLYINLYNLFVVVPSASLTSHSPPAMRPAAPAPLRKHRVESRVQVLKKNLACIPLSTTIKPSTLSTNTTAAMSTERRAKVGTTASNPFDSLVFSNTQRDKTEAQNSPRGLAQRRSQACAAIHAGTRWSGMDGFDCLAR